MARAQDMRQRRQQATEGGGFMEAPNGFGAGSRGDYRFGGLRWRDLHGVLTLERRVFPEPIRPRTLVRLYANPRVTYLAAHDVRDGHLAAYFGFERLLDGHGAHVLANATDPGDRRRGLARGLVTLGLELGRRDGMRWIVGEVRVSNLAQMAFMERMGWTVGDRMPRFFGNGEDAWMVYRCLDEGP